MSMLDVVKINLSERGYLPDIPYHLISVAEMATAFIHPTEQTGAFFEDYPMISTTLKPYWDNLVSAVRYHIDDLVQVNQGTRIKVTPLQSFASGLSSVADFNFLSGRTYSAYTQHNIGSGNIVYEDTIIVTDSVGANITFTLEQFADHFRRTVYDFPNWVSSYMLGAVISVNSPTRDIHDVLVPLGVDNVEDVFGVEAAAACYNESVEYLSKSTNVAPTVTFGGEKISTRPPTIFGEPHVIRSLRLSQQSPQN